MHVLLEVVDHSRGKMQDRGLNPTFGSTGESSTTELTLLRITT